MTRLILTVLLVCAVAAFSNSSVPLTCDTKVVHISVLFRHGSRIPLYSFPKDQNDPSYWKKYGIPGDLTPKGLKMEYDFGVYLRKYYGFLNKAYSSNRVRVRSTDLDRTLMSAQAFMSGVFEPSPDQQWNNELNWYPIPVHTEPFATDKLYPSSIPCPLYTSLRDESSKSRENQEYLKANQAYYNNASMLSGLNFAGQENTMTIRLVDTLVAEFYEGLPIPQWAKDNFDKFNELFNYAVYDVVRTPKLARLFSGTQLNEIRNNLMGKANGSVTYELSAYSTHDGMLSGLVQLLNMSLPRIQPPFGAGLIFELRKDNAQKYYVRVMAKYNNPDDSIRFQEVKLDECEDILCPLETFAELTASKIVTDYNKECKL